MIILHSEGAIDWHGVLTAACNVSRQKNSVIESHTPSASPPILTLAATALGRLARLLLLFGDHNLETWHYKLPTPVCIAVAAPDSIPMNRRLFLYLLLILWRIAKFLQRAMKLTLIKMSSGCWYGSRVLTSARQKTRSLTRIWPFSWCSRVSRSGQLPTPRR